jgi:hypothetical protein
LAENNNRWDFALYRLLAGYFNRKEFKKYPTIGLIIIIVILGYDKYNIGVIPKVIKQYLTFLGVSNCLLCVLLIYNSRLFRIIRHIIGTFYDGIGDWLESKFEPKGTPTEIIQYLCRGKFDPISNCSDLNIPRRFIGLVGKTCSRFGSRFGYIYGIPHYLKNIKAPGFKPVNIRIILPNKEYSKENKIEVFSSFYLGRILLWSKSEIGIFDIEKSDEVVNMINTSRCFAFISITSLLFFRINIPVVLTEKYVNVKNQKRCYVSALFAYEVVKSDLKFSKKAIFRESPLQPFHPCQLKYNCVY